MAENFNFTPGTGAVGAADDIAGVKYPFVKLTASAADSTEELSKAEDSAHSSGHHGIMGLTVRQDAAAALGGTDADYQPLITDASGRLHIAPLVAGTAAIGKLAANTGVDIGDVDVTSIVPGVAATNLGKARDSALGATDTGVMALVVRDDTLTTLTPADGDYVPLRVGSTGKLHVTDANITACNTGAVVLATGSAAIGKLAANTGVDIGDVDVTSVPAPLNVVGGGAEATAIRVTIANDSTGLVSIDDGGGTITVDGTVTANLSATDNAVLDTIDAVLDTINAKLVTGTVIGDVNLGATDNAVLDAIAASLVTIDSDTNDIKVATEKIDDWDATHDSAASADGSQMMAAYDSTKPTAVGDGDAVRVLADEYGRLLSGVEKTAWQEDYDSADASGEGEAIKASAASTILVVQSYVISVDAEMWVKLQEENSSALTGKFWLKAGGGVAITLPDKAPLILGTDSDLEVITEGAGNISVSVTGYTIPG